MNTRTSKVFGTLVPAFVCLVASASAQQLDVSGYLASGTGDGPCFNAPSLPTTRFETPGVTPAEGSLPTAKLLLGDWLAAGRIAEEAPLPQLAKLPDQADLEPSLKEMQVALSLIAAVYRPQGTKVDQAECPLLALAVERRIGTDPAKTLEIVAAEVAANSACACEIVKAAIKASEADSAFVAQIVETASVAAPEMMRIISQCAIASLPQALAEVQAVLAKLDPSGGERGLSAKNSKSAKSSKDAKGVAIAIQPPQPVNDPLSRVVPPCDVLVPMAISPPPVTSVTGSR